MHEARATKEWIIQEAEAACAGLFFHDTIKHPQAPVPFGVFRLNRDRDVMLSMQVRAWAEDTWIIEVVVPEDWDDAPDDAPAQQADIWADALDQRLNPNGQPRVNQPANYGCEIVSCQRTAKVDYIEPRSDEANRIHRGGFYRIRTRGP
jgi:hypothetical protein